SHGVKVVVDLSLVQGFEYYTGLIFRAVVQGEVVGSGGRYDDLHALYSPTQQPEAGIGFCLYLEPLLRQVQLPTQPTPSDYLVVPQDRQTTAVALQVLATWPDPNTRFTLEILGRSPAEALDYAKALGIPEILWVQGDGSYHSTAVV
ncbi:MAG: ATP phosphoribosyltransferase regulatory subunit, partial [Thermostichales cyanobacterium SZTDM-1c_bins_54]